MTGFNFNHLAENHWERLVSSLPKVSIIIPTFNCSQSIGDTLDGVFNQEYPNLEVIVVDANSTDRTLEVIKSFYDQRIHIYTVAAYHPYEMLNKGISLAIGKYINFLFPGFFYLQRSTLRQVMKVAFEKNLSPHLIYGASLVRDRQAEVKIIYRQLSLPILKRGEAPTSLEACWIRTDLFKVIGKFHSDLHVRGDYDLLCRFYQHGNLQSIAINRVVVDHDLHGFNQEEIVEYIWETMKVIYTYFGLFSVMRWLVVQKEIKRIFNQWGRVIEAAFLGQRK